MRDVEEIAYVRKGDRSRMGDKYEYEFISMMKEAQTLEFYFAEVNTQSDIQKEAGVCDPYIYILMDGELCLFEWVWEDFDSLISNSNNGLFKTIDTIFKLLKIVDTKNTEHMETKMNDYAKPILTQLVVPFGDHPGSFGSVRLHDVHTGIDLYCAPNEPVYAMEAGVVVAIEVFTGPNTNPPSPWWHETWAILIEGESGVFLYGEISTSLGVGTLVKRGQYIGNVKTVLKKDKGKPMTMLHVEQYVPGVREGVWWKCNEDKPSTLLDPYPILSSIYDSK